MPSTLTHWRIAIESLRPLLTNNSPFPDSSIPEIVPTHVPGTELPVLTFLGAIGPDLPYFAGITTRSLLFPSKTEKQTRGKSQWADRLHYTKSGEFVIQLLQRFKTVTAPALRRKLYYYALGHVSHIAGDIMVHPYTNTFAGAYHDQSNPAVFNHLGIHFGVEFCHDLAMDIAYFHAQPTALRRRPWPRYLALAHQELIAEHDGMSLLALLQATARDLYQLDAADTSDFGAQFLAGLHGIRTLLGLMSYYPYLNPIVKVSPRYSTYFMEQTLPGDPQGQLPVTFQQTLDYATNVSAHLGSRVMTYLEALQSGDPATDVAEVNLRQDLRDWNLDTGYVVRQEVRNTGGEPTFALSLQHCWYHFQALRPIT